MDTSTSRQEAVITILDYDLHDHLKDAYKRCNTPLALVIPGQGSAKSAIYDILGYGSPKKIVSVSLQTHNMANHFLEQLNKSIDLSKPGTGIACTISLSSISSTLSTVLKQADENLQMGSEEMSASTEQHHLIVTIVNTGFFDQVMDAAKQAGATGGTLVHARGLGSKEAIKYLGITIQPEKDLVLIVTNQDKKRAIMENITQEVGLNTAGNGICFSLPVNSISGFGKSLGDIDKL